MKYMDILGTLVNLENVAYVERKEDDNYFNVEVGFINSGILVSKFETREEQEVFFNEIKDRVM